MKDSLLVFGGGELQYSLIKKATELNFNTVLIDPDDHACSKPIAGNFYKVDGNDFDKTLSIAKEFKIKGLVTAATDHPILMMSRIASELHLPFPKYESCATLLDKGKFKNFLRLNHLPFAEGDVFKKEDIINEESLNFPIIIKPVTNSGSRGVIKCNDKTELKSSIIETLKYCKNGQYIIEKYIDGDEISVEAVVVNKEVQIIQITDKIITVPPYNVELGHVQPSVYSYLKDSIKRLLQNIVDLLNLDNCALHPELKIKEGNITLIEIGPRLGGDYITSHLVPLSTGINMEELVIKIATCQKFKLYFKEESSLISYLNLPVDREIMSIVTENEIRKKYPMIMEFKINLPSHGKINRITNSLNRYGYYIMHGNKREELIKQKEEIDQYLINRILYT